VTFLQSTPLLEVLLLEHTGPWGSDDDEYIDLVHTIRCRPMVSLPHLRVLSIKNTSASTVGLLLQAMPEPSESLSVTILDWDEYERENGTLYIPLRHSPTDLQHPAGIEDPDDIQEMIFHHVKRFWRTKSGQDTMPPGRLLYVDTENTSRIQFGVLPNTTTSIPSVFYEAQCIIKRSDPVLDPIDTIDLTLADEVADDDELAQQFEQELQHVDNCLRNLRHAVIQYMDSCQAVDIFEGWLRSRQNATRKMETLLGVARFRRKRMGIAFDADWTSGKSYVITDFVLIKLHFACNTMFDEDK
jgi:hypothetical protein